MRHSRKNGDATFNPWQMIRIGLICLALAGAGLAYVWQKNQIHHLAQQKKKLELYRDELRGNNKSQTDKLARLRLPWALAQKVQELKLGLSTPEPEQILFLTDRPLDQGLHQTNALMAKP